MRSCRVSTLLAHKPNRNEAESYLQKTERVRVHRVWAAVFLVVDNWERPILPTSPFLANFRADDSKVEALGLFDWARTRDEYASRARNNYSVLDKPVDPTSPLGRGIKLRNAVDALSLDVWRTYSESASTHRGR